ncbi:hypothetical protein [Chryseobacterium hispalense]|uniref:hypothetical protein n=1 Tax=Chryseobacterium hispalense TaxID=1453492 RepID=UPI0004932B10|nr:hypothetical protein [Chryseobacterium hispalense]
MLENGDQLITISTDADLNYLINRINTEERFAHKFKFTIRDYFIKFLTSINVDHQEFFTKYYYYDRSRTLHISESEFGYIWISTYGLIAKNKTTENSMVNSCAIQYTVISLLLNRAIEISENERIYDIDSYNFGHLSELTPALFQNIIFYIEVFCKSYLTLNNVNPPFTHKLTLIFSRLIKVMFDKQQNDSLFQVRIIDQIFKIVEYINTIPGNFKEQFVKYDDNPEDNTIIIFHPDQFVEIRNIFELCHDFIMDFYYTGSSTNYLNNGIFQKIIDNAKNEEEKSKIKIMYGHLLENTGVYDFR